MFTMAKAAAGAESVAVTVIVWLPGESWLACLRSVAPVPRAPSIEEDHCRLAPESAPSSMSRAEASKTICWLPAKAWPAVGERMETNGAWFGTVNTALDWSLALQNPSFAVTLTSPFVVAFRKALGIE